MTPSKTTDYDTKIVMKNINEKKWQYVPRTEIRKKTVMQTVRKVRDSVGWEMQPRVGKRTVMTDVTKNV